MTKVDSRDWEGSYVMASEKKKKKKKDKYEVTKKGAPRK